MQLWGKPGAISGPPFNFVLGGFKKVYVLVFAKECNQRVGFECRLGGFAKFSSEMHSSVKAAAQIWAEKAGSSSGSQAFQTQVHKCLL